MIGRRDIHHSQNFLKSFEYVSRLVDKTDIGSGDLVVEIGPGKGIITETLAQRAGSVIAVELDHGLAEGLKLRFRGGKVKIIETDFLQWKLPVTPYKVFANIPFDETTLIMRRLLVTRFSPEAAWLIMQDKAAGRFMGPPVGPISQTSALFGPFYDMRVVQAIDRHQFEPAPQVNVVLAEFRKKREPQVDPKLTQVYRDFVIFAYNQWRPTLKESLSGIFSDNQLRRIVKELQLSGKKPSQVTTEQWTALFERYLDFVPENRRQRLNGFEHMFEAKHERSGRVKVHRTR